MEEKYFDLRGLSAYSSLGLSTLRAYIKKHGLPCFKVSGKVLVQKSAFDEWLQRFRLTRNVDVKALVDDVMKSMAKHKHRSRAGQITRQANLH